MLLVLPEMRQAKTKHLCTTQQASASAKVLNQRLQFSRCISKMTNSHELQQCEKQPALGIVMRSKDEASNSFKSQQRKEMPQHA